MKWIGQHIWSFISRFRSDVYLEELGTSSETNILVVDSDGKITKNTGAGDDMTFQLEDDDGTEVTISDGKEVKIIGAGGLTTNWTDTDNGTDADPYDLTITASDFRVAGDSGVTAITLGDTVTVAGGNALTSAMSGDTLTINHDDTSSQASADNSGTSVIQDVTLDTYGHVTGLGTVELEVKTGYFRFMGYTTGDGSNYETLQPLTDAQAPWEHATTTSADGLTVAAAGGTNISDLFRFGGYVMPRAGTLKVHVGWATNNNNSDLEIGIFKWTPVDNVNTSVDPVLLDNVTITGKGNDKVRSFSETSFTAASVAAGDIIFSQLKTEGSGNVAYFQSTLEVLF